MKKNCCKFIYLNIKETNIPNIFRGVPHYTNCDVVVMPGVYGVDKGGIGFQKNSPYVRLFNHYLRKMKENGILKRIMKKYAYDTVNCFDNKGTKSISFKSCFTAFIILLFGMIVAILLMTCENLFHMKSNVKREKKFTYGKNLIRFEEALKDKDLHIKQLKHKIDLIERNMKHISQSLKSKDMEIIDLKNQITLMH